jgi:acetyl esterase
MSNIITKNHTHGIDYSGELSPEAKKIVQSFEPKDPESVKIEEMDIALARSENGLADHDIKLPNPALHVIDKSITQGGRDVRIRIYTPKVRTEALLPIFVYAHGGCWTFCSLDSHDSICRYISVHANCIVVSVDYALAPEKPFPHGLNDYCDAILWCSENAKFIGGDRTKIAVGGDSAGGNLAAAAAQKLASETSLSLCLQVLIYPICQVPAPPSSSLKRYAKGYFFTAETLEWTSSLYLPDQDGSSITNPLISPIAGEITKSLAPAFFIIAECDILRDQALAYAQKLTAAGISTQSHYYLGMPHAFIAMAGSLKLGKHALTDCAQSLNQAFRGNM